MEGVGAGPFGAAASRASIALRKESAAAARRNLELVQDAYGRGAAPIIQLIDAQTQALVADQAAANAAYGFQIDVVELYRATGSMDRLFDPDDDDFYQALTTYFLARGITVR